jgi:hypothetical protein
MGTYPDFRNWKRKTGKIRLCADVSGSEQREEIAKKLWLQTYPLPFCFVGVKILAEACTSNVILD